MGLPNYVCVVLKNDKMNAFRPEEDAARWIEVNLRPDPGGHRKHSFTKESGVTDGPLVASVDELVVFNFVSSGEAESFIEGAKLGCSAAGVVKKFHRNHPLPSEN